jgi:hypothetical protein
MKKVIAIMAVALVATGSFAASLMWGTDYSFGESAGGDITKSDGNLISVADGYYMYLFLNNAPTVNQLNDLNNNAIANTPVVELTPATQYMYDFTSGATEDSFYYDVYQSPDTEGTHILTAVLVSDDISSTIAGAYDYILFDSLDASQGVTPETSFSYDLDTVSQGDWTAIPEPSTMLLGGIGLLGLWIRRRMSK